MSFALPEAMRSYVDQRVRSGQYGNTSEYLRELIRRDQEEQAKKRLRELIEEGLNSGPGQALTPQRAARARSSALRNSSRPWNWPPTHFSAAQASTPSGAPPEPR